MKEKEYLKKYLPKERLEEGLKRLEQGEAVQYIVGNVNFYGYIFEVNSHVLIPRFETEQLIEKTLGYLKKSTPKIIDLGTGSGCIAVTLKKKLPEGTVVAYDISKEALEVARKNARLNNVEIHFENQSMEKIDGMYDLMISNPPYIAYHEKIEEIVYQNEPHIALYAEDEGIYFYDKILSQAKDHLSSDGMIAFEIGQTQGKRIKELGQKYLPTFQCRIEQDYQGLDRFVFFKKEFDK